MPYKVRPAKICQLCGQEFTPSNHYQKSCGNDCPERARRRIERQTNGGKWPRCAVSFAQCAECESWFTVRRNGSGVKFCGPECSSHYKLLADRDYRKANPPASKRKPRLIVECAQCSREFTGTEGRRFCSPRCSARFYKGFGDHIRRAKHYGVPFERGITVDALIERDGATCGLCGDPVVERWPDRMAASIDHVVPMSKGGSHTWGNVQLAHWLCNTTKGADADVDFRLEDESCQQLPSSTRPVATAA